MLWVVQNDLFEERGYGRFIHQLDKLNVPHMLIKVVPFMDKLLPATFSLSSDVDIDEVS